jgi:hypothetical protein
MHKKSDAVQVSDSYFLALPGIDVASFIALEADSFEVE